MVGVVDELTVGELSARSGVAVSALHFYEKKGLITSRRTSGNQRRYRRDVLRRVALVRIGQRVGIPLAEIAAVLATLPDGAHADLPRLAGASASLAGPAQRRYPRPAGPARRLRRLHRVRVPVARPVLEGANPADELGHQGPVPMPCSGAPHSRRAPHSHPCESAQGPAAGESPVHSSRRVPHPGSRRTLLDFSRSFASGLPNARTRAQSAQGRVGERRGGPTARAAPAR